jgi:hypothetical protein
LLSSTLFFKGKLWFLFGIRVALLFFVSHGQLLYIEDENSSLLTPEFSR